METLTLKIKANDYNLWKSLVDSGYQAKYANDGREVIIEGLSDFASVPPIVRYYDPDPRVYVQVEEKGGFGSAQLVSGTNGERLTPLFVFNNKHHHNSVNRIQALFSREKAVLVQYPNVHDNMVHLQKVDAIMTNGMLRLLRTVLWSGSYDMIPNSYVQFQEAIITAVRKANSYESSACFIKTVQHPVARRWANNSYSSTN